MLSQYIIDKTIGKGSYGHVYKVYKKDTNRQYAMKKINITTMSHYEKQNIINELRILSTHKCPFIVRFKTAFVQNKDMYIITEYACKGDLSQLIKKNKTSKTLFPESQIWTYFLQICVALLYLHDLKVIHRDLKPANIFIDENYNVKLGDFGVVKIMKSFMMYGQTQIGTPLYMCPEIYKCERYDTKVDIWSLGCVLYEMITYKTAFNAVNIAQLRKNIFEGRIENITSKVYSQDLFDVLKKLICVSPRQRPTIATILDTKFIKEQLKIRDLHLLHGHTVEPTFHIHCIMPRTIENWDSVINMFVSINSTIMLNEEEESKINIVNQAKKRMNDLSHLNNIDSEIQTLQNEIAKAMKYLSDCESKLKKLKSEQQIMQHILNNGIPKPPKNAPPLKRFR